ncbi:efflux RND transporter periplasmic adaptor subunit [Spirosoma sp. KUDC1026]|uniref:efflux RND transporter periplasmic adaptor subunit n=1 Tax=Spirosoma sp. KUDC1026 TaxID=2745947 RepID=UPI00159BD782|nr:efflux RND transporter periplasmic adaptor subunit [Spirosoma sp. KUDC1026]QKZ13869.1 efflux RND transporter periplasmic adaptor subunit [Spirosoma sp. KUDC1026]
MRSALFKSPSILVMVGLLTACGGKKDDQKQAAPPPTAVSVAKATKQTATYYDNYPATVTALREVEIQPQVSGNITGIFFDDGQRVRRGQKLYSIDPQQYRASYDQAVANLNVQKANLARAQKDADRYTTLAQQDAIARQVLDNSTAELEAAKRQVDAAQAGIRQVGTNLKYTTIFAPMDGTIGISQVRLGAAVGPGGAVPLNVVSQDDPISVDIQVDESDISRFLMLQSQKNNSRDSTFVFELPGGERYKYPGKIQIVDRAVDPQTGTIRVRVSFPNPEHRLRVGLNGNLRIRNSTNQPQLLIPYQAVTEQMSEYFVYVVGDSSKVTQKKVTLGSRINEKVIVKDGLKEGEVVVTEGTQKVREGAKVKVSNERKSE